MNEKVEWIPDLSGVENDGGGDLDNNKLVDYALKNKRKATEKVTVKVEVKNDMKDFEIKAPIAPWPETCQNCITPCQCVTPERTRIVFENLFHQL